MRVNKSLHHLLLVTISLVLWACKTPSYQANKEVTYEYTAVDKKLTDTLFAKNFLAPYKHSSDSLMKIVVGTSTLPLTKSQPESTMGNFIADAQLLYAQELDPQVKASVINYGGIRIPYLAPGPITMGNIFEIMPFDNTLVIAEVPGKVIQEMCSLIVAKKGWPIAGINIVVDKAGNIKSITIENKPINDHIIYKIAISDYLANGGDNCEFFKSCKRKYYKTLVRSIMIDYLQKNKNIHPELTQRIVYE